MRTLRETFWKMGMFGEGTFDKGTFGELTFVERTLVRGRLVRRRLVRGGSLYCAPERVLQIRLGKFGIILKILC